MKPSALGLGRYHSVFQSRQALSPFTSLKGFTMNPSARTQWTFGLEWFQFSDGQQNGNSGFQGASFSGRRLSPVARHVDVEHDQIRFCSPPVLGRRPVIDRDVVPGVGQDLRFMFWAVTLSSASSIFRASVHPSVNGEITRKYLVHYLKSMTGKG
jgi:hypothetical protein